MKNLFEILDRISFRNTRREFVANKIKPNLDTWDEAGQTTWDLHQRVGAPGVWEFGIGEQYSSLVMDVFCN